METQKIEDIHKRFNHEWLLFAIDQMDESSSNSITGRLLTPSPDPMEIHKVAMQHKEPLATLYSDDWPEDLAACFYGQISS